MATLLPTSTATARRRETSMQFIGYGPGATLTQNDATHWQIDYNGSASHEIITFSNAAAIHSTDFAFL